MENVLSPRRELDHARRTLTKAERSARTTLLRAPGRCGAGGDVLIPQLDSVFDFLAHQPGMLLRVEALLLEHLHRVSVAVERIRQRVCLRLAQGVEDEERRIDIARQLIRQLTRLLEVLPQLL